MEHGMKNSKGTCNQAIRLTIEKQDRCYVTYKKKNYCIFQPKIVK